MDTIALVCARGGSKGLPGKNIRPLAGRPLIAWAINHALSTRRVSRVIVSTDSPAIAAIARDAGAEVPFLRPAELAQDGSAEWLVWRHALEYIKETTGALPNALLVVPTTAPLREVSDLERCLDEFSNGAADVVVTMTDAHRSPYFNMVKMRPGGTVDLVTPSKSRILRRQDAPIVFDLTTVAYVARPDFVRDHNSIFEGRVRGVYVPKERAIDIDTLLDFEYAQFLLEVRRMKEKA